MTRTPRRFRTAAPRLAAALILALAAGASAPAPAVAQGAQPPSDLRPGRSGGLPPRRLGIGVAPPCRAWRPRPASSASRTRRDGTFLALITAPTEEWDAISERYELENLGAQGFSDADREPIEVEGASEAFLVRGAQRLQQSLTVDKWVVAARGADQTAIVIAQRVPLQPAYTKQAIEAALETVSLRAPPSLEEQIGALPFSIGDLAGFRPVRVTGGNSVLLTEGETNVVEAARPAHRPSSPSRRRSPAPPDRRDDFARPRADRPRRPEATCASSGRTASARTK